MFKKKDKFSTLALCSAAALFATTANAVVITGTDSAATLVDNLILPGTGLTVTSSSLSFGLQGDNGDCEIECGEPQAMDFQTLDAAGFQAGTYTNDAGVLGLPAPGIVFSTGDVKNYDSTDFSGGNESFGNSATDEQNDLLDDITGLTQHFDPVQLNITFDVDADTDSVSFIAAFGSNEWPEFVGDFVDGFGMFLNGQNVAGAQQSGAAPGDPLLPINIDHPDFAASPVDLGLNGFLAPNGVPLMRFDVPVEPGSTGNTFTLILADSLDNVVDTTVYLSSFGNFNAENGESEFTPILPNPSNPTDPETGGFVFELPEINAGETIWIDPDVAVGYTYTTDGLFASVTAPSLLSVNDQDGYLISYVGLNGLVEIVIQAGEQYFFTADISEFTLSDIDIDLMLDPTDDLAFVTGLSFVNSGQFNVVQTAITEFVDVPEPATFAILMLGLAGLSVRRKNR